MSRAYRFVRRDGWEKWLPLEEPLPHAVKVPDAIEPSPHFTADPPERFPTFKVRMFVRQPWAVEPWPREQVYVEDDISFDDPGRFEANVPSLHREQQYRDVLLSIRQIIERETSTAGHGPIGEAIAAMQAVEMVERELRRLPKWALSSSSDRSVT